MDDEVVYIGPSEEESLEKHFQEHHSFQEYELSPLKSAAPIYEKYEKERYSIPFLNKTSSSSSSENKPVINDWDKKNTNTVIKWRDDIAKNSFIYGQLLDGKEFYLFTFSVLTLVLATFMTILSGISVAVTALDIDSKWIVFSFTVIILIASGIVTTLNGIIKIFGWQNEIKDLTKIIEKLDNQWFVFETELSISADQRQNAKDFIAKADYMHLMQICPHISVDDYVKANKSYQQRLSENLVWQHRFQKQLEEQLKD